MGYFVPQSQVRRDWSLFGEQLLPSAFPHKRYERREVPGECNFAVQNYDSAENFAHSPAWGMDAGQEPSAAQKYAAAGDYVVVGSFVVDIVEDSYVAAGVGSYGPYGPLHHN